MMPAYGVVEPVKVGGEKRMPGESVELAERLAAPLVAAGALAPVKPAAPAKTDKAEK